MLTCTICVEFILPKTNTVSLKSDYSSIECGVNLHLNSGMQRGVQQGSGLGQHSRGGGALPMEHIIFVRTKAVIRKKHNFFVFI